MINTRFYFTNYNFTKFLQKEFLQYQPLVFFSMLYIKKTNSIVLQKNKKFFIFWLFIHKKIFFNFLNLSKVMWITKEIPYFNHKIFIPVRFANFLGPNFSKNFSLGLYLLITHNFIHIFQKNLLELFFKIPLFTHTSLTWFLRKHFKLFFSNCSKMFLFNNYSFNFEIKIKGKLGVAGNSRRRKFFFKYGLRSSSKKKYSLVNINKHSFFLIPTFTGVLGVKITYISPQ